MFRSNFLRHHSALAFGRVACSGHPCQKHPSIRTATLALVKATSMRRRAIPGTGYSTR